MSKVKTLPRRKAVKAADQWDLTSLYPDDDSWERAFRRWVRRISRFATFRRTLAQGPKALLDCLTFDSQFERLGERIATYAFLRSTEDVGNSTYQGMVARYRNAASRAAQASSYIRPEILAIPGVKMARYLSSSQLKPYHTKLERLLRHKPHTLTEREENLLAMQSEMDGSVSKIFNQLNNADLRFGTIKPDAGSPIELSHSTFSLLLHSGSRQVRRKAFHQYYKEFEEHRNTLAATLEGSIQRDVFHARARGHGSALAAALFADNVPISVYDNLIESVHRILPSLYRYFEMRRRRMRLRDIHHYDTYAPIVSGHEKRRPWNQAVRTVVAAMSPLGNDYCGILDKGLREGWCDRYENQGKQSGAFSCGSYDGAPYILMNYQPAVLDHLFTLAHEAGHSMHSYYSAKHQPFQYYNYTIFVAEVASTFNEQLLSRHLLSRARTKEERAFLVNREIDSMRGTIIRQTMFAEFEKIVHEIVERNEPLTVERFTDEYRTLLDLYFGPGFVLDPELSLECFRIPHFYRAFYVYKYATGMSAALALSDRVANGGKRELGDYLDFLKGGCSLFPLDLLRNAGVDLEQPDAVDQALSRFELLVEELDEYL